MRKPGDFVTRFFYF